MITRKDIDKLLNEMSPDGKSAFLSVPREEQLLIVFAMEASNSNRLAIVERKQIEFEQDNREYRNRREQQESNDIMTTTQKILKALAEQKAKEFDVWIYLRDKVLPPIITAIMFAILWVTFGGKIP